MQKKLNTDIYYTPIQLKIPIDLTKIIDISDEIFTFNEVIDHIDPFKYMTGERNLLGRKRYDEEKLFKVILFAFMQGGYASLRNIEKSCKTDVRFIWLLDGKEAPSYKTVANFINKRLSNSVDELFKDINRYVFDKDSVDLNHLYIDGTKIEANANKYKWVWKKNCITNRAKLFAKISRLFEEANQTILHSYNVQFGIREEYQIEYIEDCFSKYQKLINVETIPQGKGHRRTQEQKIYIKLKEYLEKLKEYAKYIEICGEKRNSYAKTDKGATFMRMKTDYMGNDQLLPAYNIQVGACDEYISVIDVQQYAADTDCFIPLIEKYKRTYDKYPQYPVADAGYGSYNNYLYCEEKDMGKYMKFTMFAKETDDKKYRDDPYRVKNFKIDIDGDMICPNGKKFKYLYSKPVKYNRYGRTEEVYECENCADCPYVKECKKGNSNRKVILNEELSSFHEEVLSNLNSTHGGLLRMNRSIQAEGIFGIIKWDKGYKRAKRRGIKQLILEFTLIAIGFNLYKYHNKTRMRRP